MIVYFPIIFFPFLLTHGKLSMITPKGLLYYKDYITEKEHSKLLKILNKSDFNWDNQPQRRKVKQYGFSYNYRNQSIDYNIFDPFPEWCQ